MISGTSFSIDASVAAQQKLSTQIATLQTQISSGTKVNVASDDPVAMRRIAQIRTEQASQNTWASNVTIATQISGQVQDSLNDVQTQLTRAKELIIQAQSATSSGTDRSADATELQGIIAELHTMSTATDFTGQSLYAPSGTNPVAIPVGDNLSLTASASYDQVFGSVKLSDGSTTDIMTILGNAVTAMQNNDVDGLNAASSNVDASASHISVMLTNAGTQNQRITAANDRLNTAKIDLEDERSSLQDTDVTAAAADLTQKQTQLQAAQTILAQLAKNNLFDKLA